MQSLLIHMGEKHIPRTTCTQLVCNRHTLLRAIQRPSHLHLMDYYSNGAKIICPRTKKEISVVFFIFLFSSFLHQFFISLAFVFFLLACLHRAVCMRFRMGWGYRHLSFVQMTFLKLYKSRGLPLHQNCKQMNSLFYDPAFDNSIITTLDKLTRK